MILVDIYVPSIDKTYNFQLNETIVNKVVIEEVAEMISHKEQVVVWGEISGLVLCHQEQKKILPQNSSLQQCGVRNGSRLILV